MTHSKGISWFDDCRIPYTKTDKETINFDRPRVRELKEDRNWILTQAHDFTNPDFKEYNTDGRFPANLLVCDDMLNDGIVYSSGSGDGKMEMININDAHHFNFIEKNRKVVKMKGVQYNDKGSNSRYYDIDKWFNNLIDVQ